MRYRLRRETRSAGARLREVTHAPRQAQRIAQHPFGGMNCLVSGPRRLHRTSGAIEQFDAELRFELLDQQARRRLRDPQLARSPRDAARTVHAGEGLQLP